MLIKSASGSGYGLTAWRRYQASTKIWPQFAWPNSHVSQRFFPSGKRPEHCVVASTRSRDVISRDRPSWPPAASQWRHTQCLPSPEWHPVRVPGKSLRRFRGEWALCVYTVLNCDKWYQKFRRISTEFVAFAGCDSPPAPCQRHC